MAEKKSPPLLPFPCSLNRSRRRTLAIHIHPDATVEIRAPLKLSQTRIWAFVREKTPWILQKRAEALARQDLRKQSVLSPGDSVSLLGRTYPLETAAPGISPGLADGRILLPEGASREETAAVLAQVCRRLAKEYLPACAAELAQRWGFSFQGVSITGARTRWGSCSGKNHLNFSLRLAWASLQAVDYVILHELAHTWEHNHSPRFWAIVAERMPGYRQQEAELKALQRQLSLFDL